VPVNTPAIVHALPGGAAGGAASYPYNPESIPGGKMRMSASV
jgi:hypothetical protein